MHHHPLKSQKNLPVGRDTVDDLARLAAVAPLPAAAAAEPILMLVVLVSPGSLDAGLGSADPPLGATIRDGGRTTPAPAALPTDAVRVLPMPEVIFVAGATLAPAGRMEPLMLLGAARSFAARLGRWMPAKRDAGAGATLSPDRVARATPEPALDEELEFDNPWGGRPTTTPPAAMPAGGRCTPRMAGRVV